MPTSNSQLARPCDDATSGLFLSVGGLPARAVVLFLALAPGTEVLAQNVQRTSPPNTVYDRPGARPAQAVPFANHAIGSATGSAGQLAWYGVTGGSVSGSNVVTIGNGVPGSLAPFPNNLNVYPVNAENGIQLGYGTGAGAGLGGSLTFFTKNPAAAPVTFQQELGFMQAYAWNGSAYNFFHTPLAVVFGATEAWTPTANGAGVIFQIISRGETNARGELSIAEGVTAMAPGATRIVTGKGVGTINGESGVYDGGKRVLSASNLDATIDQDNATRLTISNSSTGTLASADFVSSNANGSTTFGTAGPANGSFSGLLANKGVMHTQSTLDGLVLHADGASHPIQLITDGTERARALQGFMVGTTTDPGAGVVNVATGFRVANAAASGNVLRGNGTDFVSSALAAGDLSGLGAGVAAALGTDVGSAGAFVTVNGALGTPSAGVLTKATGLPISTGLTDSEWTAFTPTVTSQFGTARTVSATGRYKIIGKTVIVSHDITITHAGTAGGYMRATLPVTAASHKYVGNCVEASASGKSGASAIIPSIGTGGIITRDASARSWWISGHELACTTTYEMP